MESIKCFIECLIPVTACNLKCSYCYVIQREGNTGIVPDLEYPIVTIRDALTRERFGGCCYFSICGAGETLMPKYTLEIVRALLENGHYVNITTNGTLTSRFKELECWGDLCERLHFAFSFHYLELQRLGKIDAFFENVRYVKSLGCSFVVQLNLCDEYMPYIDEIKKLCIDNVGAWPQLAATRKEIELRSKVLFETSLPASQYISIGKEFESPLFEFTVKNFNVRRREFCYAGSWAYQLNLNTGILKPCYHSLREQNIFADPSTPLMKRPVGRSCGSLFCMNSSHFMSLGVIPEFDAPTYAELRDRPKASWYSERMSYFLGGKLEEQNEVLNGSQRIWSTFAGRIDTLTGKTAALVKKALTRCELSKGHRKNGG